MFKKRLFTLVLTFSFFVISIAGKTQVKIGAISVEGNNKTKSYILFRELPYRVGDIISLDSLAKLDTLAQQQLFNTSLFLDVAVASNLLDSQTVSIHIKVKERWYFFPIPYFRWVDRSFSEWWNVYNHSLDRVNYGINLRQANATGNNDKLSVGLITGYTHQAVIKYQFPYIDNKLKYGLGIGWLNFTQKEVNTATTNDKQLFLKTPDVNQKGYRGSVSLLYRPNLFERHTIQLGLGNNEISDTVYRAQPNFLPNQKKSYSYFDLTATFTKVKFNYNAYPTKGSSTEFAAYQRFSTASNFTSLQFRKVYAHPFSKSNFFLVESNSVVKFMPNMNYLDSKLVGYGNMQLSGLEYYVVDGNAASILKAQWHHSLGSITVKNFLTDKFLPSVKYQFWLKVFSHLGYVYSDQPRNTNKLSNTLLRTAGIGMDIISIYDFVLKIDYSVNQLGDKGVYLHGGINF